MGTALSPQRQFLTFRIGEEEYGVDVMAVMEIRGSAHSARLPNAPDYMPGVMNLRGLIVPLFDLRILFRAPPVEREKNVVVILAKDERHIGVMVDDVCDIIDQGDHPLQAVPGECDESQDSFVAGLMAFDDRMIVLLKAETLFSSKYVSAET